MTTLRAVRFSTHIIKMPLPMLLCILWVLRPTFYYGFFAMLLLSRYYGCCDTTGAMDTMDVVISLDFLSTLGLSADEDEDLKNCFLVVVAEDYPKLLAAVAGDRKFDVYMGIDVFGRRTYGGGQWNTNVALDVMRKDGVSATIFAPGWVYETKQGPNFETAQNREAGRLGPSRNGPVHRTGLLITKLQYPNLRIVVLPRSAAASLHHLLHRECVSTLFSSERSRSRGLLLPLRARRRFFFSSSSAALLLQSRWRFFSESRRRFFSLVSAALLLRVSRRRFLTAAVLSYLTLSKGTCKVETEVLKEVEYQNKR
ncbi:hypothetical protein RIF29_15987 [Crotalaria pallida]|uniref:Cytosolic endo-beta-N-acetylglucosaminidase TIM barrel domain-containing protein n=1 Tax=Crotalaria pallida TaxID=3830 RepID=A0AAN9IJH4_CROPI